MLEIVAIYHQKIKAYLYLCLEYSYMSHHSKKLKEVNSINNSKQYHCPRCGTEVITEFDDSFDCPRCRLEFEKADCDRLEDDSAILSINEKYDLFKAMGVDPKHPEKHKKYFEDL